MPTIPPPPFVTSTVAAHSLSLPATLRLPSTIPLLCALLAGRSVRALSSYTSLPPPGSAAAAARALFAARTFSSSSSSSSSSSMSAPPLPTAALLQFHVTPSAPANMLRASLAIEEAMSGARKPSLLVLPEVWNSPYATAAFPEHAQELPSLAEPRPPFESPAAELLSGKAREHNVFVVGGSVPEREGGRIYNTCMCFGPGGELVAKHR
jgi:omega-amidase